ncbi:GHKL domain-containing protein [Streptococcus cristatus]|uniref:sensor histidine kinase n=1 Tax=Streptococcus cristatus TaxID=45634 RepID=UPI0039C44879
MFIGLKIVALIFQVLVLFILFSNISGEKMNWKKYLLATLGLNFIGISFEIIDLVIENKFFSYVNFLTLPIYFSIFSLLINKNIPKVLSIFYGLFPVIFWNVLYRLFSFFLRNIIHPHVQVQIDPNKYTIYISAILASLLSLFLPRLLYYDFKRLREYKLRKKDIKLIIFLNISMILYYIFVKYFTYIEMYQQSPNLYYREIIVVVYIILFLSSVNILDRNLRERIQQQLSEQRELQLRNMSDYSQHIEELYNELRSFRHDYINILRSLKLGIDTHDLSAIEQIYNQVLKDSGQALNQSKYDLGRLSNIHNDALKSVLSAKFLEAQNKGIEIDLEVPQEIKPQGMELLDFITIVSILADNAMEAAVGTSRPVVSFAFLEQEGRQIFIVENTIKELSIPSDNIFKKGFSTKGENRGLGLSNVQNIISHYPNVSLRTISHDYSFRQELEIK